MNRRRFLQRAAQAVAALSAPSAIALDGGDLQLAIEARKFEFRPATLTLVAGRRVILQVRATDFAHGFSIPDLGIRRDLVPGQTVEIALEPARPGRFPFLCDNFCGEGHDTMTGVIVVTNG